MFELLEPTGSTPLLGGDSTTDGPRPRPASAIEIDRATIVAQDLDKALRFFGSAFGWNRTAIETRTLRYGSSETRLRRIRERAGRLTLELIEPKPGGDDSYSKHAARGAHGLAHAGGTLRSGRRPSDPELECEWVEDGERFVLYDWVGVRRGLQLRA